MTTMAVETGASPTAGYVQKQVAKWARQLQKSAAFGIESIIRGELAEVWEECSEHGWDGYHGFPVTWDLYHNTERFLRALPLGTCAPSIGADPDGQMTLEWGRSKQRRLSVSVSPDGELHYAALLGAEKTCGSVPFFSEVPGTILSLIRKVC